MSRLSTVNLASSPVFYISRNVKYTRPKVDKNILCWEKHTNMSQMKSLQEKQSMQGNGVQWTKE
jgi:hypothetical protein